MECAAKILGFEDQVGIVPRVRATCVATVLKRPHQNGRTKTAAALPTSLNYTTRAQASDVGLALPEHIAQYFGGMLSQQRRGVWI
jgi:hypothetical protein